jgi:outer membrane protein insertion porin family
VFLPIKLGPRSYLYDVAFEGNEALVEGALHAELELGLGAPVSQVSLEKARRRLLDLYAEEGFAFAEVETALDLSPDHTRARARFVIRERDRVKVSRIVVRGANLTSERLIRSRVALQVNQLYRRSLARKTEEWLATLGVFSSVNVGLEDPYVPAREKVVVITVEERKPQYLDVRPGFSTGEGFRITFEYGHRNLVGEAVQLTLRSQLGYLPEELILEPDVRQKYDDLELGERLERRNSAALEFPEIGLGPLFRLSVEGVDVRDNARDFGITKDAGIVTLAFRPDRRISVQLGASLELNDATIFGTEQKCALVDYVVANPRQRNTFRVPEGTTLAKAQRIGVTWDRRDSPLDATEGHFISFGVEHVRADPLSQGEDVSCGPNNSLRTVFEATSSQFLRYTGRVAGYLRLSRRGLALALSLRGGVIQQLFSGSQTYPDRLFFMGGVDTIRGFAQDGLIPEDIAKNLLDPSSALTEREVVIRGGDLFVNPRAELRIPLTSSVQTAVFVDAGNLWTSPFVKNLDGSFATNLDGSKQLINPFRLRYSTGTGLRVATPIGPLVFDYGFNIERVLDRLYPERKNQRIWEDLGAFHFSIGLF